MLWNRNHCDYFLNYWNRKIAIQSSTVN